MRQFKWKARFMKVDKKGKPARPMKRYTCVVRGHNMTSALGLAVDHMIDHVEPITDGGHMRIVKLEILDFLKR